MGAASAGIALIVDSHRYGVRKTCAVAVKIRIGRIDQTIKRGIDLGFGAGDRQHPRTITRQRGTRATRSGDGAIIDGNSCLHDSTKIVGIADREGVAVPGGETQVAVFGDRLVTQGVNCGSVIGTRHLNDKTVAGSQCAADAICHCSATVCLIVNFDRDRNARIYIGICRCKCQAVKRGVDIGKSAFQNQYFVAAWALIRQPARRHSQCALSRWNTDSHTLKIVEW